MYSEKYFRYETGFSLLYMVNFFNWQIFVKTASIFSTYT